ncbi:Glucosylceramidase, partial [Globisporangium splendens]
MAAAGQNTAVSRTQYGTSSLASDDALGGASARRNRIVKWGVTALVAGVSAALIALTVTRSGDSTTPSATASTSAGGAVVGAGVGASVLGWQSSYINGEKKMMEPITGLKWKKRAESASSTSFIAVDVSKKFQEMLGFGGAFTEAAALQFAKLSPEKQEEVLELYFDKEDGAAYEFGRVPMGSCDFSVGSYSFNDVANDTTMSHFDSSVSHDTKLLIPFIQRALEKNPKLKMLLAPWSPPVWMKRGSKDYVPSMLGSVDPVGLRDDARGAWALYFSKFISAYKNYGINFWGLTPQNEPEFAAPWEACKYNAPYEAEFIGSFLGPVIKRDHPDVKIMVFDHNRDTVHHWADTIFNHPEASKYVEGIASHWYGNEGDRVMDGVKFHEHLNDTHYVDESRFILATESSSCPGVANGTQAWFRGQRYAHDMIADFNNWVVGWVDWNLILDHTGGPNHLGNNCDAPIIIDETDKDYYLQPMYYFIKHFSKFVPPGSRRIHTDVSATFKKSGDAQLYVNYPAELHTCDNSARQAIHKTDDNKLQVTGTPFCIDLLRPDWVNRQVALVECQYTSQSWTFGSNGKISMAGYCLALNHGSTADGVRVTVNPCSDSEELPHELWNFKNGSMYSSVSPKCVTAGYSFVQSVGFVAPENKKVLVVLNENTEDAEFELQYGDLSLETVIPQGAIQTFTWE